MGGSVKMSCLNVAGNIMKCPLTSQVSAYGRCPLAEVRRYPFFFLHGVVHEFLNLSKLDM